jgi:hypothetical protein
MRLLVVVLCLAAAATTGEAKDCTSPRMEGRDVVGLKTFSDCVNERVAKLEADNAALRDEMERLRGAQAEIPGALTNDNGKVTQTGGAKVGQASFTTAARKGQTAAGLPIDQTALETLCAVGCTIHLALTAETLRKEDPPPVFADATCTLRYTAQSGAWAQTGGCGEAVSGVDGDGKPPGNTGGDVLAVAGEACLLADAEPGRGLAEKGQVLGTDRAKGLFLIAAPLLFTGSDARFRCEMRIGS